MILYLSLSSIRLWLAELHTWPHVYHIVHGIGHLIRMSSMVIVWLSLSWLTSFGKFSYDLTLKKNSQGYSEKQSNPFSGMTVRDFLGFPSLQEVECSGKSLKEEDDLLSLTLYRFSDKTVVAALNTLKGTCKTFSEYSSCNLNIVDTKKSQVRTLVSELEEGETVFLGCNATSMLETGHPHVHSWTARVYRRSKFLLCVCGLHREIVVTFGISSSVA